MKKLAILYKPNGPHPMVLRPDHLDALRAVSDDVEVILCETEDELIAKCPDAEILFCWGRDTPSRWVAGAPSLRWIQSLSAGVEGLEALYEIKPDLVLSKISGVHGIPMSESAIMYILMFLNQMPFLMRRQLAHRWQKAVDPAATDCFGKTVGIVGIGDIGRKVAEKCKFFGMTVLGCRRTPVPMDCVDQMYPLTELGEMLKRCDFVVSLVPDAAGSRHMFDASKFACMKPEAVFVSLGRGAVIDENAMIDALRSGKIAGAALDVFETEPLPADSPLWDMENVVITPHCSADTPFYFDRAIRLFCANLRCYLNGEAIPTGVPRK